MNAEYQNPWKNARECAGLTQEAAAELPDLQEIVACFREVQAVAEKCEFLMAMLRK